MDAPRFIDYHSGLIQCLMYWGMPMPWWIQKPSKYVWLLLITYDSFTVAVTCFVLYLYIYTLTQDNVPFEEVNVLPPAICFKCCVLAISLLQFLDKGRMKQLSDDLDALARTIIESDLGQEGSVKESFLLIYSKRSKFLVNYCRTMLYFAIFYFIIYFGSVPLIDWLEGAYRSHYPLPLDTPFDGRRPGIYELLVFATAFSLTMVSGKQINNTCIFLAFFNILRSFLHYLSITMSEMQKTSSFERNDPSIRRKIRVWIQIHQEVNRNLQVLLKIFSPVVIIYSIYLLLYLMTAIFMQMQKKEENIYQTAAEGLAVIAMVRQIYVIFSTADQITTEAQKLAYVAYELPWYQMDKNMRRTINMIMIMCNKPVRVTGYRAKSFILNRETIAGIMTSAVSGYLTLCQMTEALGPKESSNK
ncbi:unnamed protein product [Nezara viridula]|uniref:Odorant receptor n=1 Tax=Nezara viridula TaxID=85310 RepID=A0A9P0H272_NEZVI|nr:unnamed protein product [Nezara viridula]